MKATCDIVKDLMPLYIEHIASADSAALVEEHTAACENCGRELERLFTPSSMPVDTNTLPLRKIRTALKKKKVLTVLLSVMLTLAVAIITACYLTAPVYLPHSDEILTISAKDDGTVLATFGANVSGYDIFKHQAEDGSEFVYRVTAWKSIWSRSSIRDIVLNPDGEKVVSVYYYLTDGSEDVLVYGANLHPNGGGITLPRLVLNYYAEIALALAVISGLALFIFRKNEKARNVVMNILLFPTAYLIAHICIAGLSGASYSAARDFFAILLVSATLYTVLLAAKSLVRLARRGKKDIMHSTLK